MFKMNKTKIALVSCEVDLTSNGLRSISSQLKKYGYLTKILFLPRYYPCYAEETLADLYSLVKDSDLIGLYCMDQSLEKAVQIIKFLKSKNNDKNIVWGGIYATLNPDECLKHADIVCVGEGEGAVLDLVEALEKNKATTKIKNLWIKKNGKIYKNAVRSLIEDINTLPFEDYDFKNHYILLNDKIVQMGPEHMNYGPHNLSNEFFSLISGKFVTIHTTRGCPYSCAYCCNYDLKKIYSKKGRYVRSRVVKNVIAELLNLKKNIPGLEFVWFTDDDFFIRSKKEISYFAELYKKEVDLPFMCYVTPTSVEEEKLKLFIATKLARVEMGIQTGSERLNLQLYQRNIQKTKVVNAAKILNKLRARLPYFPEYQFICTNPFETKKDVLETLNLITSIPTPFFLRPFNMTFFRGSYMWRKACDSKVICDKSESCSDIFYSDGLSHLRTKRSLSTEVLYLNVLLNLMRGNCTRLRYGKIPRIMLKPLLSMKLIRSPACLGLLTKVLRFSPYTIIFWKLPYSLRSLYLRSYIFLYKKVYFNLVMVNFWLKCKYKKIEDIIKRLLK